MPTIGQTLDFIRTAHAGQTDRIGVPYWRHPLAVMLLLPPSADEDTMHAALLHDVLEDTAMTHNDLLSAGYSDKTIDAVVAVTAARTRLPGEPYVEWVRAIGRHESEAVVMVKYADLRHNLDLGRLMLLEPEERARKQRRYGDAQRALYDEARQRFPAFREWVGLPPVADVCTSESAVKAAA